VPYLFSKDPVTPSISIPSEAQEKDSRICWQLLHDETPFSEKEVSPWSVIDIQLYPTLPSPMQYILQFRLNMACDISRDNISSVINSAKEENDFHVMVQYSNDQGITWNSLHNLCLPPTCTGQQSNVIQVIQSNYKCV
jgi:hypothetical protein